MAPLSPSTLYNGFADFGWDGDGAGVHIKLIGADSDLTGNGTAPVELLDADCRAVFTHPDNTRNRYGRISLHPWMSCGEPRASRGAYTPASPPAHAEWRRRRHRGV